MPHSSRMRRVLPLLLAFPLLAASTPPARAQYGTFTLTRNKVAVQFASYGTMGNLFVSRSPSLEYPNGSGYEHLTDAGIWIGARTRDGGGIFTAVSTAAEDAPLSTSIVTKTEFTPADFLVKRSTLPESPSRPVASSGGS